MPHLRLEYSSNLPAAVAGRGLFSKFHEILEKNGVDIGNCKSRSEERSVFLVGDGRSDEAFVHLDVRMLEGRSSDAKRAVGEALLATLISAYERVLPAPQITVEICDIIRGNYFKHPTGTI